MVSPLSPDELSRLEREARSPLGPEPWRWAWVRGRRSWCVVPTDPLYLHPGADPADTWGTLVRTLCGRGCWTKAGDGTTTGAWWRESLSFQRVHEFDPDVCAECRRVASWCGLFRGYVNPVGDPPPVLDRRPVSPGPRTFSIQFAGTVDDRGTAVITIGEGSGAPGWSDSRWGIGDALRRGDPPHLFPVAAIPAISPPGTGVSVQIPAICGVTVVRTREDLPPVWAVCPVCRILAAEAFPVTVDWVMDP